jgi:hypothetical protein
MYWNISIFQRKGNYSCRRCPCKHFTHNWYGKKWVKFTQKWYGRKWVKRRVDEYDRNVWEWEVIAMAGCSFRDGI